jgi:hypothetical protein
VATVASEWDQSGFAPRRMIPFPPVPSRGESPERLQWPAWEC